MSEDRWERLFADLSVRSEDDGDLPDLVEAERVALTLHDRLRAAIGADITVRADRTDLRGVAVDVGKDWLRLERQGSDIVVALAWITRISALGASAPKAGLELSLTTLLRALARSGATIVCAAGGEETSGRVRAVAADHIEIRTESGDAIVPIAAITHLRAPHAAFE